MKLNIEQLWNAVLEKLRDALNDPLMYNTWFKETKIYSIENDVINIIVPFLMCKKHIKKNYENWLEDIVYDITGKNYSFAYYLEEEVVNNVTECQITEVNEEKFNSNLNFK